MLIEIYNTVRNTIRTKRIRMRLFRFFILLDFLFRTLDAIDIYPWGDTSSANLFEDRQEVCKTKFTFTLVYMYPLRAGYT